MTKESQPEYWEYRTHTSVKHALLGKYLSTWITILGKWDRNLNYFDCFAGRGEYNDGTPTSPVRAVDIAIKKSKDYDSIFLAFIEKDYENFNNLKVVLEAKEPEIDHNKIEIFLTNDEFSNYTTQILNHLKTTKRIFAPSLFFMDPFGYSGVPFDTINQIMSYPKTEIFFNFMVSHIARFISNPSIAPTLTNLFGTDEWIGIQEGENLDRERALVELYRKQLHTSANVQYSLPFKINESDRSRTLYYLIHATNSIKGHNVMKDIMYKEGTEGFFAYLGPNDLGAQHQTRLFDVHDIEECKKFLTQRYQGKTLAFDHLLQDVCQPWNEEPPYLKTHYNRAVKALEKESKCCIERITSKKTGVSGDDKITF